MSRNGRWHRSSTRRAIDVWHRDGKTCQRCRAWLGSLRRLPAADLRAQGFDPDRPLWGAHHKVPRAAGGPSTLANLELVCQRCHDRINAGELPSDAGAPLDGPEVLG